MSSQLKDTTTPSSYPLDEKSQCQVPKEGGYDNFQHFMQSHKLKMQKDDDAQQAQEIFSCYEDKDRVCANDKSSEHDKPHETSKAYDSNSDSDSGFSCGVRIRPCKGVDDDEDDSGGEKGCPIDGALSFFEWGVDEPEFEGYPVFSDEEEGYNSYDEGCDDEPDDDDWYFGD
ncbi:hypothetical protein BJX76DRAFT_336792 [Aspergillus varians]